jgi:glycosyltransferase involved in cell wall biosynthesis
MKISVLAFPLTVKNGGPPVAVVNVLKSLSGATNNTISVVVFGPYDSSLFSSIPQNVTVLRQKTISKSIYSFFLRWDPEVIRTIKESDQILIHGYYFWYVMRIFLARNLTAKLTLMPHGVFEPYQKTKSRRRKYLFNLVTSKNFRKLNLKFIVASESEVIGVREQFQSNAIEVAGLPIRIPPQYEIRSPRKLDLGKEIKLLHLGRISQKKRIDLTIKCLSVLRKGGLDVSLSIIGDGDITLKNDLARLAKESSVDKYVNFLGQLDGDLKYEESLRNHILLLPSENENFAISVAEALLMGIPCVVSKNVALSEVILNHKIGMVVNSLEVDELSRAVIATLENYSSFQESIINAPNLFINNYFEEQFFK